MTSHPTRTPNANTGEHWRALGFYHEPDVAAQTWRLVGTASGLRALAHMLTAQADRAERSGIVPPFTIGPYDDLRIRVWERAGIDDESIYGSPDDLRRLSRLVESGLASTSPGSGFVIGSDYVPDVEYRLSFEVKEDGFDAASAGPALSDGGRLSAEDEVPAGIRSPELAFAFNDPDGSFTESEGMVWLEDHEIVMEYQTKDAFFGTFRSAVKVARVPADAISWVKFKRGMFGAELTMQARAMKTVEHIATSKQGRLRLKFARDLRDEAEHLAGALQAMIERES